MKLGIAYGFQFCVGAPSTKFNLLCHTLRVVKNSVKREMPWDKLVYTPITAICFLHIKLFEHIHIYIHYINTYIDTYAYIYTHTRMVVARHFGTVIPSSGKHVKYILAMP